MEVKLFLMLKAKSYAVVWLVHRDAAVNEDLNALVLLVLFPDGIIPTFTMSKCSRSLHFGKLH